MNSILHLQRTIGNQAVERQFAGLQSPSDCPLLQAKLSISSPEDGFEREADRIADTVVRMPEAPTRRGPESASVKKTLRTKQMPQGGHSVPAVVVSNPKALRGSGRPLPESSLDYFEPRFDRDFRGVRVHTGPAATEAARLLGARAFTVGNDIAFGLGEYDSGSGAGRRLLAHELTHTVQQRHSPLRVMREPDPAAVDLVLEAFEQELQSVAKAGGIYVIRGETQTDGRPVGYVGMSTDLAQRLGDPTHFKPRAIISQCEPSTIQAEFYVLSKQKVDVTLRHRPYTDRDVLRWIEQNLLDQTAGCVELLNARREMNEQQFNDMTANVGSAWTDFLEGRTQWTYADSPFREDCPVTSPPGLIPSVDPADWVPQDVKDWWEQTKENKEWLDQQWWWPG